jgi:membrane-bound lytic murein transglycosylase
MYQCFENVVELVRHQREGEIGLEIKTGGCNNISQKQIWQQNKCREWAKKIYEKKRKTQIYSSKRNGAVSGSAAANIVDPVTDTHCRQKWRVPMLLKLTKSRCAEMGVYTVHVKVGAQRDKEREIEIKALYLDW